MTAQLATTPTHRDLATIGTRLSGVETALSAVKAQLTGVDDSVGRVEHMTDMLLQAMLEKEKKA